MDKQVEMLYKYLLKRYWKVHTYSTFSGCYTIIILKNGCHHDKIIVRLGKENG